MADWLALTDAALSEMHGADAMFRPTRFWQPGVERLVADMRSLGLERFKAWPTARIWFYPLYGPGLDNGTIAGLFRGLAGRPDVDAIRSWFSASLAGHHQARRDYDAARLAWDEVRWPFDLDHLGESQVGAPTQIFRPSAAGPALTRPYLNYLLCLAGLSRHVDAPPRRWLELGGGYGVLGEIVLSRDPDARYINVDIPPLLMVASYYLDALFGDRVMTGVAPPPGRLDPSRSACLPTWRFADVDDDFDVFVNTYSFQEMEPPVVRNYARLVAERRIPYVLSLNSVHGKDKAASHESVGVEAGVTSSDIVSIFAELGYGVLGRYGDPLVVGNAELVVLGYGRSDAPVESRFVPAIDLRRPNLPTRSAASRAAVRAGTARALARRATPRPLRRLLRRIVRRR